MNAALKGSLERIQKATAAIAPAAASDGAATPAKKSIKPEELTTYISEQVTKAKAETVEVSKARLTALEAVMKTATEGFAKGSATVEIDVFADPPPPETPVTKAMKVLKSLHTELSKGGSLHETFAKSKDGKALIQKAGVSATALLERVATMFGYDMATLEKNGSSLAWKVEDAVRTLEQAARMEKMMTGLTSALGMDGDLSKSKKPDETNTPEEPAAPVATPTKKSGSSAWGSGDLSASRAATRKGQDTSEE